MQADPARPTPAAPVVLRWGLPDALLAWIAGTVAGLVATLPFVEEHGNDVTIPPAGVIAGVVAQSLGIIVALVLIARAKGRGGLREDFGLRIVPRDLWWIGVGVGLSLVAGWMLLPITELAGLQDSSQEVVRQFEDASGIEVPLFVLGVVLLAPLAEELLFRGVLLRALARRTDPTRAIFASALIFALVHVLGDTETYYYVPAFLLLGLVSGWRATKTGNLSQSVMLHVGFNLLASILIVA